MAKRKKATRVVIQADACGWLERYWIDGGAGGTDYVRSAIVTSMPDANEIGMNDDLPKYELWFAEAAMAVFRAAGDGPVVFYQTDRKHERTWWDKTFTLMLQADMYQFDLRWHKIVQRRDTGKVDLRRPTYSHMLAFSRVPLKGAQATPDVLPWTGAVYDNGMDFGATEIAVRWASKGAERIIDPFCGRGTVLAVANAMGIDAIGIDSDQRQCKVAEELNYHLLPQARRAP